MKLPKNKDTLYIVERTIYLDEDGKCVPQKVVIATFLTPEGADNFAGACEQEFLDQGYPPQCFKFETGAVTYYGE